MKAPVMSIALAGLLASSCTPQEATEFAGEIVVDEKNQSPATEGDAVNAPQQATPAESLKTVKARELMVKTQFAARDITNTRVLDAMRKVRRHEFVPKSSRQRAYNDHPLPIGYAQTISQPYIVALMTQLADPQPHEKALDVGTGSGYQAAVLGKLVDHVYSIEIVQPLAENAAKTLNRLGYDNVTVRHGDGYHGWPSEAPFDVIIVAAAPDHIPKALVDQLAPGGKLVVPVGNRWQTLILIEKNKDGKVTEKNIAPVAFVPMTGDAD